MAAPFDGNGDEGLGQEDNNAWVQDEDLPLAGNEEQAAFDQEEVFALPQITGWEVLWQFIVHRAVWVTELPAPPYPDEAWTLEPKDPPFPFNLDATWYCGALIGLMLAVNWETEHQWLLSHGYLHYFARVLSRTTITVATSVLSTFVFEVIGNVHQMAHDAVIFNLPFIIDRWLVETWGMGPVDEQGRALTDAVGDVQFHPDRSYRMEIVRDTLTSIVMWLCEYLSMVGGSVPYYHLGPASMGYAFMWVVRLVSPALAKRLSRIASAVALPTPDPDQGLAPGDLLREFGAPAGLQVGIAGFLYLCVFLFMSRAETPVILRQGQLDGFSKLAFHLIRATAMHLLAYTAYQVAWIGLLTVEDFLTAIAHFFALEESSAFFAAIPFIPVPAFLLFVSHWFLKKCCLLCVRLLWTSWVPYIAWLSIKTTLGTQATWGIYRQFVTQDMDVLLPGNRVLGAVIMTALCGLRSSWPSRMKLSSVAWID
ncbi:hypothetical protein GGS23DRAFT_523901 [Durotheca rogersii]|uniref:uncharacterized protein n=1 Tax=Durotheca rogersii TaxID=419775 RepID=UPI00221F10C8|nr:uncharacterized protein GGS23DRAFT_523901 [Durotheca rogersii]KAI5853629.1 hypothetical protein GGS23DRAFT_523901 [Durotheca rogersii]